MTTPRLAHENLPRPTETVADVHTAAAPLARSRRISVLHLIHTMAYGGVETAVINWLNRLDPNVFDVHLVCFANPGHTEAPFVTAAELSGLRVDKIPWGRRKPLVKASRRLAGLIRKYKVDILHTHNWYADFVGALTAKFVPVKTITTLYVWSDYDWKRNLIQAVDRRVIRHFDLVTTHCDDTHRKTVEFGFDAEAVKTLICGFETNRVELEPEERLRRRREMGVADDDFLLVNVARFYPEKCHDFLLRCFRRVRDAKPQTKLWIAGVGPLEEQTKKLCTELGLDSHVRFVGFVRDLPEMLSLVDAQVHPATIEGVPLAICSGMAAELPIVASGVGGMPEILNYGRNGLIVPAGDEGKFVAAVLSLIDDPGEGRRLARAARHFIENDYSLTTAVRRVEQTYRKVLGSCESAFSS